MSELRLLACAVLLAGGVAAVVAAATVRISAPETPRVASVRLGEMTAAWTMRAATQGRTADDVRAWGEALEGALVHVAERRGVVLLPARAVAAGAPDVTWHVEAVLAERLTRGPDTGTGTARGDGR